MLVITFDKNVSVVGGFGDRIVGLIAVKLISKLLKKKFYISWTKEDVQPYIDYKRYDFELLDNTIKQRATKTHYGIDSVSRWQHLIRGTKFFKTPINKLWVNQEIAQYLYKLPQYKNEDYFNDIFTEYRNLYTNILIPTDYLMTNITTLVGNRSNIVGVQIRCGDRNMITNKNERHTTSNGVNINQKLLNIRRICTEKFKDDYSLFLTSDTLSMLDEVLRVFKRSHVIYNEDLIQHLDRKAVQSDISKVFIDNYILSQKTSVLFISTNSNYGRVAALSAVHKNIYDLDGRLLDKKLLVTKGRCLFT